MFTKFEEKRNIFYKFSNSKISVLTYSVPNSFCAKKGFYNLKESWLKILLEIIKKKLSL